MVSQQRQTPLLAKDHDLTSLTRLSSNRRRRKRLLIAGVAAALLGGGSLIWTLNSNRSGGRDLSDYTVEATRGSLPGVITASGELEAIRRVNVSPRRQGLLEALLVDEGAASRKGRCSPAWTGVTFKTVSMNSKLWHVKPKPTTKPRLLTTNDVGRYLLVA